MKKFIVLLTTLFLLGFTAGSVVAGSGPAPNSGDGISDGSGMDGGPKGPYSQGSGFGD
jgi:hypothetical protein